MKTIFDKVVRDEIVSRINSLNESSKAQWGKMNVYQMVKHCALWEEMIQSRQKYKRAFMGRIFGKMALKSVLKDVAPLRKNSPTIPEFKIGGSGDTGPEKLRWISAIEAYAKFPNSDFVHPFFGTMTKEQIGYFVYKHADHHLRQFGA